MYKRYFVLLQCLVIGTFIVGCASRKESRELARVTLAQTMIYESEVDKKINAEKQYYKDSIVAVTNSLGRSTSGKRLDLTEKGALIEQNKISKNSNKVVQPVDVTNFITSLLVEVSNIEQNYFVTIRTFNEELKMSLIPLKQQKDSLKKTRQNLEKLQAKESELDQFRLWFSFVKEVDDLLDEDNEPESNDESSEDGGSEAANGNAS